MVKFGHSNFVRRDYGCGLWVRMAKRKTRKARGSSDPALSAFKALQRVIESTEGKRTKKRAKKAR